MGLGIVAAQKSADVHLLPSHVPKALQDVFGERDLNGCRHFPGLAQWRCKDVVILNSVLELLHEPEWFALNDLAGSEQAIGDDETVNVTAIAGIGSDDEPVRERVCVRDNMTVAKRQRLFVVTSCLKYEMALTDRIEVNPDVMLGKPVIRGTRIPVELILRKLREGASEANLLDAYPRLTHEDIVAAVRYADAKL